MHNHFFGIVKLRTTSIIIIIEFLTIFLTSNCNHVTSQNSVNENWTYHEEIQQVDAFILKKTSFSKEVLCNGKLNAIMKSDLKFKVNGELRQLKLKNGDLVKSGQTIALLDPFEFLQKFEQAEAGLKNSYIEFKDILLGYGSAKDSISKDIHEAASLRSGYTSALRELKIAQHNLDEAILKSPFSGKVADINFKLYEQISSGEVFCTIINDTQLEVEFYLVESEISLVSLNDKVKILPFSSDGLYKGNVSEINPRVDENGLIMVKAKLENDGTLWEGMNVKVLVEKEVPNQLVVPKSAIIQRGSHDVLFKFANGIALWTYVKIEAENSSAFSVTPDEDKGAALHEGDTIIVSENFILAHESKVKIRQLYQVK